MKKLTVIIVALLCYFHSNGQAMTAYAELLGPGIMSANFDSRFSAREDGFGGRVGIGGFVVSDGGERVSLFTVPLGVNYLLGKDGKNYFEMGVGYTFVKLGATVEDDSDIFKGGFGNLTLGYRLAPTNGGFMFKAQITPIFNENSFVPYYCGIGFGYKF